MARKMGLAGREGYYWREAAYGPIRHKGHYRSLCGDRAHLPCESRAWSFEPCTPLPDGASDRNPWDSSPWPCFERRGRPGSREVLPVVAPG